MIRSPAAAVRFNYGRIRTRDFSAPGRSRTRSEPAKSTKWNFETTVTHSPPEASPVSLEAPFRPISGDSKPRELAGRPPRAMAEWKLGVAGRPNVGEETLLLLPAGPITEPGRPIREGDLPPGGRGDDERGGGPLPVNFFCISVNEKIACERDDWAFMSVSFVRRMEVP